MVNKLEKSIIKARIVTISIVFVIILGTVGYIFIEGWSVLDAFYMTIITLTSVGFGEIHPLSYWGRLFTILLIASGLGIIAYGSSTIVQLIISGDLRAELNARRRRKMLEKLGNHDIICGFGRMGQHVATELKRQGRSFVIIDQSDSIVERCRHMEYMAVHGSAANEEVLIEAGIRRARSLITVVNSDAGNVFIVLTARGLRPDLIIVTRVNYDDAEAKLRRAGANQVISPYVIGGRRMVSYVEQPGVVDFLDVVMHSPDLELWMREFKIESNSPLVGQSLRESRLRLEIGVNVLSIRYPGQPASVHPDADQPLQPDTQLIALGTPLQLNKLATLTGHSKSTFRIK